MQLKLEDASVGCMVGPTNKQVLWHIAWAKQVRHLVNAIGGLLITPVCDALLLTIHLALGTTGIAPTK
jgi:hypothetical protein